MRNIYSAITLFALTSSNQFGSTKAVIEELMETVGKKPVVEALYDANDTHIVIDEGDQEIGELIYHPAN